jgi:hypothetical protein
MQNGKKGEIETVEAEKKETIAARQRNTNRKEQRK